MKKLFLLLSLLLPAQVSAQTPEVYLETNAVTANRGDTIEIWANFNNNSTQTRTIYFDFSYQRTAFSLVDVSFATAGADTSAIPTGTTTSLTNLNFPGYNWVQTTANTTTNGLTNYQNMQYAYTSGGPYTIRRLYGTVALPTNTNLGTGRFMRLKFEVQNTAHDFVYDSLYMNFAFANSNNAGWLATNNAVSTGYRSAFFTISGGTADVLIYGTLDLPSSANIGQLQPRLKFFEKYNNVPDTLRHTESVGSNGIFSVTPTEVDTDTDYRIYLSLGGPDGDSIPSILNTAITVSDFTAAETEFSWQSLTTGNFVDTLFTEGVHYMAADVNDSRGFDPGDTGTLFAQVAGVETVEMTDTSQMILKSVFDTVSTAYWRVADSILDTQTGGPYGMDFHTDTTATDTLNLKYFIPGDVNLSYSSALTVNNPGSQAAPVLDNTFIDVNLNNLVVTSNSIEIPFEVSTGEQEISALQFEVLYDPSKLRFETMDLGVSSWIAFVDNQEGRVRFGAVDRAREFAMGGDFTPFSLKFVTIDNPLDIVTQLRLSSNMDASSKSGHQIGITLNSNTIRLIGYNNYANSGS